MIDLYLLFYIIAIKMFLGVIINNTFYINENEDKACRITGLAIDEIEFIVGRFSSHSIRKNKLRGKIVVTEDGKVQIRKCFGNKLLWECE